MDCTSLGENLFRLRRERNVTQEELADFVGVTKAAISKWENGVTMPDIQLLPQLAAYYSISIDELLRYAPQLSKEQIQRAYHDLAQGFASLPFSEAYKESKKMVRKYYSCYPFILQVSLLYLNHFQFAPDENAQKRMLVDALGLCGRVLLLCNDLCTISDATTIESMIQLQLGNAIEVVEKLEGVASPERYSRQDDSLLMHAYIASSMIEEANSFSQISMYMHMLTIVGLATQQLSLGCDEPDRSRKSMQHMDVMIQEFNLEELHPSVVAQFYMQAAFTSISFDDRDRALKYLSKFQRMVSGLIVDGSALHGDDYFDAVDMWFSEMDVDSTAPVEAASMLHGAINNLELPVFDAIRDTEEFQTILNALLEMSEL